jgi:hypothetical protein
MCKIDTQMKIVMLIIFPITDYASRLRHGTRMEFARDTSISGGAHSSETTGGAGHPNCK